MKQSDLLATVQVKNLWGGQANNFVQGLCVNSKQVSPGDAFVALPSVWEGRQGGEQYISMAIKAGAKLIVTSTEPNPEIAEDICWVQVENPHETLSELAKTFYGKQPQTVAAVTGTNGKSSIVDFIFQIWQENGYNAARMGTIGVKDTLGHGYGEISGMTTPDAITVHKTLQALAENHVNYLAMEASSHALDQHRMDGVNVRLASFTNLTHEHLDYHPDVHSYFSAKARLFQELLDKDGVAILNVDDVYGKQLVDLLQSESFKIVTFGQKDADVQFHIKDLHEAGLDLDLNIFGRPYHIHFPLIGHFQVSNAICALANGILSGVDEKRAVAYLQNLQSVPGRLQKVNEQVYVDYAHTPDALATALRALRPHTRGKLGVVFGCGGNRDPFKRPLMGQVAAQLADRIYVTDDNPRFEDAAKIRAQVMEACPGAVNCTSRHMAINEAVQALGPDDMLLIAGKGHETDQIVGAEVQPFNDVTVAKQALALVNAHA